MKGGKQNSTTCNTTWKNKGHQKRISYKSDAFVEEYSFTTAATVIKYLQAALALSSQQLTYKYTDPHHVQPRRHHDPDGPHLMQHPHLASHCLGAYKPTELPVLHCVQRYFFSPPPPCPFSAILLNILRRELHREPPTVSRWRPLLDDHTAQETALHSPSLKIFLLKNNGMLWRVCHIIAGMQVEARHTYSNTCGFEKRSLLWKHN